MTKHDPKVVCFDRNGEVYAYDKKEQEEETLVMVFDRTSSRTPKFYRRQDAMIKQLDEWGILYHKINAEALFKLSSLEIEVKDMMSKCPGWSRNKIIARMFLDKREIQRSFKTEDSIKHGVYSTKLQVGGNLKDNMILSIDFGKGSDTGMTVVLDKREIFDIDRYIASMSK